MQIRIRRAVKMQNKLFKNAGYWFARGIDLGQNNRDITFRLEGNAYLEYLD